MSSTGDGSDTTIRRLTIRIKLVEGAKKLASKGEHTEALKILRRVREAYSDPRKQAQVDRLIVEVENNREDTKR